MVKANSKLDPDDVIEIKKPDPDSHFLLRPCKCGSDNVAYVHYEAKGGEAWRVKCFDCGYVVDKGNKARHDAQINWNKEVQWNMST